MNSHGRALSSLMLTHLDDAENYDIREGEFVMSSVVGWQFGDGHLHDEFLHQRGTGAMRVRSGRA